MPALSAGRQRGSSVQPQPHPVKQRDTQRNLTQQDVRSSPSVARACSAAAINGHEHGARCD
eukprot:353465-Chlamydomonas_euryale.AAC.2